MTNLYVRDKELLDGTFFDLGSVKRVSCTTLALVLYLHPLTPQVLCLHVQTLCISIPDKVVPIKLPYRHYRSYHLMEAVLEWKEQGKEGLQTVNLNHNSFVFQINDGSKTAQLAIPVAFCVTDRPDPMDPTANAIDHVYMRLQAFSTSSGPRNADASVKLEKVIEVEDMSLILGVRHATQGEMDALARGYYELPQTLEKGDIYLPDYAVPQLQRNDDKQPFIPRHDVFEYFSRLNELNLDKANKKRVEEICAVLAADYTRYTKVSLLPSPR